MMKINIGFILRWIFPMCDWIQGKTCSKKIEKYLKMYEQIKRRSGHKMPSKLN